MSRDWEKYETFDRRINLKNDFGWTEEKDLRRLIEDSDMFNNFPADGYTLVSSEIKAGDEDQYIDLLYLRDDGALLPCELKIGGNSLNTHGQLIRYIADLSFQKINLKYINELHASYLDKRKSSLNGILRDKFDEFLHDNNISDKFIRVLPRSGIIMDEIFKPQILKTVRYLNEECGFSIRLIEMRTFTDQNWKKEFIAPQYRIDFVEIT